MPRSLRIWIPVAICVVAVVIVAAGKASETSLGIGCALFAVSSSIGLLNWFYHLGVDGDLDRDHEQAARDFFEENGRWPNAAERAAIKG